MLNIPSIPGRGGGGGVKSHATDTGWKTWLESTLYLLPLHHQSKTYTYLFYALQLFTFFPLAGVRSIKALICFRLVRIKPNS